ncbi:hypothetical protein HII36_25920 [Nonomuraea sp. NN258]|uniref:hypothetical protein n=1 Tax=Nonomuraea antri TaxID=2730852 RepID=UPI001569E42E|nr:hypothetical protein [Nonomuraea antri]NRQ35237.1 hypothetical protein [Nonomuraea antri]
MNRRTAVLALAAALTTVSSSSAAPAAAPARYTASLTVLESPEHGPQLCVGVQFSDPPQCTGLDVAGWDWSAVRHEAREGVRWGDYRLVGTWDGARLTITEPPGEPARHGPMADEDLTPCPEPAGGWPIADGAKTTWQSAKEAMARAESAGDFAGAWFDQPPVDGPVSEDTYDPGRAVVNVAFTGGLAGREEWIREIWGGPLCLSRAQRTEAELRALQGRVSRDRRAAGDFVGSYTDISGNRVVIMVWVATDELRRELDAAYGPGAVELSGILQPVN